MFPPTPYKFLRATCRNPCCSSKCRLQGLGNALPLLQTLAGLVTQTLLFPKIMYSRREGGAATVKGAPFQQEMKWHPWTHCHQGGQGSNLPADSNLQTSDWHAIIFKITFLLPSGKYNVAFNLRKSAMSSNYTEPQVTSEPIILSLSNSYIPSMNFVVGMWLLWSLD